MSRIVLTSEQAERWGRCPCCYACHGHGHNTDSLGNETRCGYCNGTGNWLGTWTPPEQPERVEPDGKNWHEPHWKWQSKPPYGAIGYFRIESETTDLHAALVTHWWQEINGNEGEPPGQVELRIVNAGGGLQFFSDALLLRAWGEQGKSQYHPCDHLDLHPGLFRVRYELTRG